jgi:hypothetical protein
MGETDDHFTEPRAVASGIWSAVASVARHRFGSAFDQSKAPSSSRQIGTMPAHSKFPLTTVRGSVFG